MIYLLTESCVMKRLNVVLTFALIALSIHLYMVNLQQQRDIESLSIQIVMLRHQTNAIDATLNVTGVVVNELSDFVMDNP